MIRQALQQMSRQKLDLLIIGGGITGAGIALDASQRGLQTGLVEMQDFAEGTSSRSTKLIHGGLRYLKQGEVQLVREVGRERAIVYKNAPHLVKPAPMLLPLYKGGTYGRIATSIGLYLYDWLAGVERKERRKMLSKEETLRREPSLNPNGLVGGGLYVEYRTDDARLTIEVLKTAKKLGAQISNYTEVVDFLYEGEKVVGVRVVDHLEKTEYKLYASKIVNATGPWVDELRKKDRSLNHKHLRLTKGVHLVFAQDRFPLNNSVYFDTPDGRMIFAIPRGRITYVGTTDTIYAGDIENPQTLAEDRDYILRAANSMFPSLQLTSADVISNWAGLRPLIYEEGKGPSELSRKDEVFLSHSGLITIAGGKLTGFRKMAERVVNIVCQQLGQETERSFPSCATDRILLSGGEVELGKSFAEVQEQRVRVGVDHGVSLQMSAYLADLYGSNAPSVYERISTMKQQGREDAELRGQILYSIEEEDIAHLSDFLIRRTGALFFAPDHCQEILEQSAAIMGEYLKWDTEEKARQIDQMQDRLNQACT